MAKKNFLYKETPHNYVFCFFLAKFFRKKLRKYKYTILTARRWVVTIGVVGFNSVFDGVERGGPANLFFAYHNNGLFVTWYSELEFTALWSFLYFESVLCIFKPSPFRIWVLNVNGGEKTVGNNEILVYFEKVSVSFFIYLLTSKLKSIFLQFNSTVYVNYFLSRMFSLYHHIGQSAEAKHWYQMLVNYFSASSGDNAFSYYFSLEKTHDVFLAEWKDNFSKDRLFYFLKQRHYYPESEFLLFSNPNKSSFLYICWFVLITKSCFED